MPPKPSIFESLTGWDDLKESNDYWEEVIKLISDEGTASGLETRC